MEEGPLLTQSQRLVLESTAKTLEGPVQLFVLFTMII